MKDLYFSIDIETDGPIPAVNSMLSFAAVVFDPDGNILGSYEANLLPLPDAVQDAATMKFWEKFPEAWEAATSNARFPRDVMQEFLGWVYSFDGRKNAVCHPVGFDFTFLYWYLMKFAGESPFGFSAIDIKTYVMSMRKTNYRKSSKGSWPRRWFKPDLKHTHKAIDDALEQGVSFMIMLHENLDGVEAGQCIANRYYTLGGNNERGDQEKDEQLKERALGNP